MKKRVGVTREHADELIQEMLTRVATINGDPAFLYKVTRLAIFGSYLGDKAKLGDIDIAVELQPKVADHAEHSRLCAKQWNEAPRHFDFLGRAFWPQEKALRALKARHCAFSFHDYRELERLQGPVRDLFKEDEHATAFSASYF